MKNKQQAAMTEDLGDIITPEESEAHEVRRLRWILRVSEKMRVDSYHHHRSSRPGAARITNDDIAVVQRQARQTNAQPHHPILFVFLELSAPVRVAAACCCFLTLALMRILPVVTKPTDHRHMPPCRVEKIKNSNKTKVLFTRNRVFCVLCFVLLCVSVLVAVA